jgi:hypothetical protein
MNLDALLEDLEAEGYFASRMQTQDQQSKEFCKSLLVVRENAADIQLALPLLGKDFIAGFQNRRSKSTWLIIQNYNYLQPQDSGTRLQLAKLSIKTIIEAHLIGTALSLAVGASSSEHIGFITSVIGNQIEFISYEGLVLWIPLKNIEYLAVEKLSIESKV